MFHVGDSEIPKHGKFSEEKKQNQIQVTSIQSIFGLSFAQKKTYL